MNLKFDIPEALKPNFQRVYRRIPMELRQNPELIKDLVLFLKVGGERLARQHLEVTKNDLKLVKTALRKERRREAMRRTAAAAAENAAADNGAPNNGGDETVHAENRTDASGTVDTDQEKDAVAVEDDESVDDMDSDVDDLDAEEEEDTDFDD
jgi:hypothetical protein